MSRAAFLPSPGDPYVLMNCLKYFLDVWSDEVDTLYIQINSDIEKNVIDKLLEKLNHPKIKVIFRDAVLGHGTSLKIMLDACDEDYIMLIEDDSIIFKKGTVDSFFKLLESDRYDVIGSPRMSCNPKLADIAKSKFSLDYSGYGDKGPNFWPCFLWATKDILLKTSMNFNNFAWDVGDNLLGTILDEKVVGDTFVKASLELRELGARILEIPQYHSNPDDLSFYKPQRRGIFDGSCSYIHFGSLSSGISSYLADENGRRLKERTKDGPCSPLQNPLDMDIRELERRIAWWQEGLRVSVEEFALDIDGFEDAYRYALSRLMTLSGMTQQNVSRWVDVYKGLM